MRKIVLFFLGILFAFPCLAQINVQFVPEINGRNLNGLYNFNIINGARQLTASLRITVSERSAGMVCSIRTPEFSVMPGTSSLPPGAAQGAAIQFGNNKLAQLTSQSRNFPEGDYEYCYELTFKNTDNAPLEQCFSYTLAPFFELSLIDPYNQDKICEQRPLLTWQPLLPGIPGSAYQLILAEIKSGQNATEALNYNLPIINQNGINAPVLPYPSIIKELEKGKKYAWQVTAYKDQTILNRSEVWEFTVDCQDSVRKADDPYGYRDLEDLSQGNYYIANGFIKFAFVNSYGPQKLIYEILAVNRSEKSVKHLPKVELTSGRNQITIDLSDLAGIIDGSYYIMHVKLPGGITKSLRFIYNSPK